jgi:hypothetical protein
MGVPYAKIVHSSTYTATSAEYLVKVKSAEAEYGSDLLLEMAH